MRMTPGTDRRRGVALILVVALLALVALGACVSGGADSHRPVAPSDAYARLPAAHQAFLDTLEHRTFQWFWDLSDARTGLTPDRWPTRSFASVGAVGFALTAYPIGAERGWVTRAQAAERVLATLRFFWSAPQDSTEHGVTGYQGFFYHFLVPETGERFKDVELSTIDTSLMLAGMLFCQSYFDRHNAAEDSIRSVAEAIYARVDWNWAQPRPPSVSLGWTPKGGHLEWDWRGYNEAMILQILALGSTTHAVEPAIWAAWCSNYQWGTFLGKEHVGFAPLFGHQYSQVWIDFRGIQDEYMRGKGIDYFENSRRATLAQRAYAVENPGGWAGYGVRLWGLSACDGPLDGKVTIHGVQREFHTYTARGASFVRIEDDGTVTPTAAAGSIAFVPEVVIPTLMAMRDDYGPQLFGRYGFLDAVNPTLRVPAKVPYGVIDTTLAWFDTDYLGIDQGPIVAMIENYRSGLVWRTMRRNPHIVRGLKRAGFTGGWLSAAGTR
jgi:hypothetical protein